MLSEPITEWFVPAPLLTFKAPFTFIVPLCVDADEPLFPLLFPLPELPLLFPKSVDTVT